MLFNRPFSKLLLLCFVYIISANCIAANHQQTRKILKEQQVIDARVVNNFALNAFAKRYFIDTRLNFF